MLPRGISLFLLEQIIGEAELHPWHSDEQRGQRAVGAAPTGGRGGERTGRAESRSCIHGAPTGGRGGERSAPTGGRGGERAGRAECRSVGRPRRAVGKASAQGDEDTVKKITEELESDGVAQQIGRLGADRPKHSAGAPTPSGAHNFFY